MSNETCTLFEKGHKFVYDAERSGSDKSVFYCLCGKEQIEHEDAGTGA